MKIAWNLWTYKEDSEASRICIDSLISHSSSSIADIFVWDDKNNPLSGSVVKYLKAQGCRVTQTDFKRNGNLRGESSFIGMSDCYKKAARQTKGDFIAKIDSDILVIRDNLQSKLGDSPALFSMGAPWNPYGNVYLMRKDIAPFLRRESRLDEPFSSQPFFKNLIYKPYLEDRCFFICACMYFGHQKVRKYLRGSFWDDWDYTRASKLKLKDKFADNFVVNFGGKFIQDGKLFIPTRQEIAAAMRLCFANI